MAALLVRSEMTQSYTSSSTNSTAYTVTLSFHSPAHAHSSLERLLIRLQKRRSLEPTTSIKHSSRARPAKLLLNLLERRFHAGGIRYICADADSFATGIVDFVDDVFVAV